MAASSMTGPLTQAVLSVTAAPGTPAGPLGLGGAPASAPGSGWEIFVRSYKDYTTLLCQVPSKTWTQFTFVKMLDDLGSGSVTLSQDDTAFWASVLGDGAAAPEILNYECLWQFCQDGVPRFEFLGETITEQLVDPSEQRLVTVTGPGSIAALKWAMAAPQGFPDIVNKLDGLSDTFDEISAGGVAVIDTDTWTTLSPSSAIYITPVASAYSYPGGAAYQLASLYPTGTLTLQATSGTTVLGSAPWDATDTLVSLQITPAGSQGTATDANGNPVAYGTGLDGSELTQVYIRSLKNAAYYAGIGLTGSQFYCFAAGPGGLATKVISSAAMYDSTNDAYWMITEQGGSGGGSGTFFFWTSSDGANWKLQWQVVHSWDATYTGFYVSAKYDAAGQSAVIQNLNSNVTTPSYQGNLYLGMPLMGIWTTLLQLAQARGTTTFVTSTLTGQADSFGNAWTDTNNVQVTNGTDLYSMLQSFCATVNADYVMQPGFNLQVGLDIAQGGAGVSLGTDRSSQVIFREARDELAKQRTRTRNLIANLAGAENQDGHEISAQSAGSIAVWGQREAWYQTSAQVDPVSMEIAAAAFVAENATEVLSWTLSILPNQPARTVFTNFDVGDWVGLEEAGGSPPAVDPVRVTGIAVAVDENGVETHELTLVSYLQWLEQQLAYLSNKLGGAFVATLGTTPVAANKYGIGTVPTYFSPASTLGSLADVIGTGSAPDGAPLVYNAATGKWQPATSADPSTGAAQGLSFGGPGGTVTIGGGGVTVTGQPPATGPDGGVSLVTVPSITTSPTGQVVVDPAGNTRITVGYQPDGTITVVEANGPAPSIPDTPTVVAGPSGLAVGWDGLLAGAAPKLDFQWTEVHVSTASGFTPSSATLKGTLSTGGGVLAVGALTTGTTYYARLLARNSSGAASGPSTQASGVPIAGGIKVTIGAAPGSPGVNDLWFDSANGYRLNQWTGSAWVPYQYGTNSIAALSVTAAQIAANTITAAQIAAGTITATQIAATTITGAKIAAGTIVAGNISTGTITAALLAAGIVVAGIVNATTVSAAEYIATSSAGEFLAYSSTSPGAGTLINSIAGSAGSDSYSNAYPEGFFGEQLTLADTVTPPAFAGSTILFSDTNGRLRYLSSAGNNSIVDRSGVSVGTFTLGNTGTAGPIGAPLAYLANESNQSTTFEIDMRGTGNWGASPNNITFWLYLDGVAIGGGASFIMDAAGFAASSGFAYRLAYLVSFTSTGSGAAFLTSVTGTFSRTGLAMVPSQSVTVNGVGGGTACDSTVNHTLQAYAQWASTGSGETMTTYQTILKRMD